MSTASGQMFYGQYTRPLLETMATKFRASFNAFTSITAPFPASAASYYNDLRDSALITVLRAEFVFAAYDSIWTQGTVQWRKARLSDAIQKLQQALVVVQTRESQYRVPLERIAAWGRNINPTSYVVFNDSCFRSLRGLKLTSLWCLFASWRVSLQLRLRILVDCAQPLLLVPRSLPRDG